VVLRNRADSKTGADEALVTLAGTDNLTGLKYSGDCPCKILKAKLLSLYVILACSGSQWSSRRIGVLLDRFGAPVKALAVDDKTD
jgi:hypothetical protein